MQDLFTFLSHHSGLTGGLILIFVLLMVVEVLRAKRTSIQLSAVEATQKMNHDDAEVIDIRAKDKYNQGHIIDAQSQPAIDLTQFKKWEKWRTKPLIFVCQNGLDSQKIAAHFIKEGFTAYTVRGGMDAWKNANMPTVKD